MNYRYLHQFTRSEHADRNLPAQFFMGSNRADPLFAHGYGDAQVLDTATDDQAAYTARIFASSTYNDKLPVWLKCRLRTENPRRCSASRSVPGPNR